MLALGDTDYNCIINVQAQGDQSHIYILSFLKVLKRVYFIRNNIEDNRFRLVALQSGIDLKAYIYL